MSRMSKWTLNQVTTELPSVPSRELTPPEPTPGEGPSRPGRPRRTILAVAVAAAVLVAFVGWAVMSRRAGKSATGSGESFQTATVERRHFVRILRVTGTVQAVESRAVLAPTLSGAQLGSLVITRLTPAGSKVKRGDLLVEFDPQNQIKNFLDKQAEYRDLAGQVVKKQADEQAARGKDETELKQTEDALKKAELENLKNEVISRIDAEKNQQTLEEAKANLKQLLETFDLKRRAAQSDIRVLEIQRDRARQAMLHAQRNQEKMTIRSPMDGIAVLNTIWKGGGNMGEVQEGDEVRPGVPFMQVVNPSAMEVRARVNQADVLQLRAGQHAQVHLDAYPEMFFSASVEQVAPMGIISEMSDKVHTFTALFSIQGNDPKLMPDLSAAVDVELERQAGVLVVPRDCVLSEGGRTFVRVKRSLNFEKVAVKLGAVGDVDAVIESGVKAGEVVERNVQATESGT